MEAYLADIESLIFAAHEPISVADIKYCIENAKGLSLDPQVIEDCISLLQERYSDEKFGIEPVEVAGGYQFLSKSSHYELIAEHIKLNSKKKLSKATLETLAIIAYKQPVSKTEIEQIRGVNSDYGIGKLLEKELIELLGRSESVGKPLLYGTSQKFMQYFGLKSMADLPKLKEFALPENAIGEAAPFEESSILSFGDNSSLDIENAQVEIIQPKYNTDDE